VPTSSLRSPLLHSLRTSVPLPPLTSIKEMSNLVPKVHLIILQVIWNLSTEARGILFTCSNLTVPSINAWWKRENKGGGLHGDLLEHEAVLDYGIYTFNLDWTHFLSGNKKKK
jgi:hypothetical protein